MLPKDISNRINQYYKPGNIFDYDEIIGLSSFFNLFAQIEMPSENDILIALTQIGFKKDNRLNDLFFINYKKES